MRAFCLAVIAASLSMSVWNAVGAEQFLGPDPDPPGLLADRNSYPYKLAEILRSKAKGEVVLGFYILASFEEEEFAGIRRTEEGCEVFLLTASSNIWASHLLHLAPAAGAVPTRDCAESGVSAFRSGSSSVRGAVSLERKRSRHEPPQASAFPLGNQSPGDNQSHPERTGGSDRKNLAAAPFGGPPFGGSHDPAGWRELPLPNAYPGPRDRQREGFVPGSIPGKGDVCSGRRTVCLYSRKS